MSDKMNANDNNKIKSLDAKVVTPTGADAVKMSTTNDEEIIENLELLINLESLEQADAWEELMNLTEVETADDAESEN